MAPEIKNLRLFHLRENSKWVVWLEVGVCRQGILTLHPVAWVIEPGIDAL